VFISISELYRIDRNEEIYCDINFGHIVQSYFRDLDVPTCIRLAELLSHLQDKGEEACREFYSALHLHVEDVYFSLPTRLRLRDSGEPVGPIPSPTDRYVINDHSKSTFSVRFSSLVVSVLKVLKMFLSAESKQVSGSSSALGLAAMGLSRKVRDVLIWYIEDGK
uniref:Caspase recruitment domain family, member 19 n=1 Tax=Sinocyclocheilus grahami TaxID=75366 RepID=A0A672QPZ0_SINGR